MAGGQLKKWRFRTALGTAFIVAFLLQIILGPQLADPSVEVGFYIGVLLGRTIMLALVATAIVALRNWVIRRQRKAFVK